MTIAEAEREIETQLTRVLRSTEGKELDVLSRLIAAVEDAIEPWKMRLEELP